MNEYIRLIPDDNPLIALAEQLGYQVYINHFEVPPPEASIPRYKVVSDGLIVDGNNLVDVLKEVIEHYQRPVLQENKSGG